MYYEEKLYPYSSLFKQKSIDAAIRDFKLGIASKYRTWPTCIHYKEKGIPVLYTVYREEIRVYLNCWRCSSEEEKEKLVENQLGAAKRHCETFVEKRHRHTPEKFDYKSFTKPETFVCNKILLE